MKEQNISVEDFADIRSVIEEAKDALPGVDVLVLPGDGADMLIELLTCRCGKVVCPQHMKLVRQRGKESMIKVPLDKDTWTPYFPQRVAQIIADQLKVVV